MKLRIAASLPILSLLITTSVAKENNLRKYNEAKDTDINAVIDVDEHQYAFSKFRVPSEERDRFLENIFSSDMDTETDAIKRSKRFIVKYKSHEAMSQSKAKRSQNQNVPTLMSFDSFDMEVVKIKTRAQYEEFEADDNVLYVEQDQKRYLLDAIPVEKDKRHLQQSGEQVPYGINMVKALDVDDDLVGNRKVCIIDTGYDISHPDLPSGATVSGNNNGRFSWKSDNIGHGSHVAGTIAAVGDNGIGVVGVNRNGKLNLHIEKLFKDNGRPIFGSTIIGLVGKCVAAGSNIISMSLGGPIGLQLEREVFERVLKQDNVLVIAAAGNSGNTRYSYPASYSSVLSVAAIDSDKKLAYFSQRNDEVDIAAPGVAVLSVKSGGGYIEYSGTSMATPHTSGVAALVWSHFPDRSATDVSAALMISAEDLGAVGRDNSYGYGLVQADKAFELLGSDNFSMPPTVAPTPVRPCFDFEGYKDGSGRGCGWYEGGLFINRCAWYGNSRPNNEGVTGNDACCTCGGGSNEVSPNTPTISPAPTKSPTSSPTGCVDDDSWVSSRGRGCDWYGPFRCLIFGDSFASGGVVANEACCLCKSLS